MFYSLEANNLPAFKASNLFHVDHHSEVAISLQFLAIQIISAII
jgi:hypothetical protein